MENLGPQIELFKIKDLKSNLVAVDLILVIALVNLMQAQTFCVHGEVLSLEEDSISEHD